MLQSNGIKKEREREMQEEQLKYQEYLSKKQQIEELKELREIEIERSGKGMRDA